MSRARVLGGGRMWSCLRLVVWCLVCLTDGAAAAQTMQPPTGSVPGSAAQSTPLPNFIQVQIPDALPDVLAQLHARSEEIRGLVERGDFASIYVPALQAKDLALALEAHRSELPPGGAKLLGPALNRLVRCAYLLDAVGDLGNKEQIDAAHAHFAAATKDVEAAFAKKPGGPR